MTREIELLDIIIIGGGPTGLACAIEARRAGFNYLLVPTGFEGNGPLGNAIAGHEAEWGLTLAASAGDVYLFRVN